MKHISSHALAISIHELSENGASILEDLYSESEILQLTRCIDEASLKNSSFLQSTELFAIRQLLNNVPELKPLIFNHNLLSLLSLLGNTKYFLSKGIYFDKPPGSNWFVSYHQDLSISVVEKVLTPDFSNWTYKRGQHGVQPPLQILENIVTIRIHLDETTSSNGALRIIPGSHLNGIIAIKEKVWDTNSEKICEVPKGGVMLMKPLTLHASRRSTNQNRRRVIHLEFSNIELNKPLKWLEQLHCY